MRPGNSKAAASDREDLFAKEYVANGRNGAKAAETAGYSKTSARRQAVRMLEKPSVKEKINALTEAVSKELDVSIKRNIQERATLAYYDVGELVQYDIKGPKDIAKIPEHLRRVITGWKWDKNGRFMIQLADKHSHLTALDKHLGVYDKDNQQKGAAGSKALQEFFQAIYGDRNKLPINHGQD